MSQQCGAHGGRGVVPAEVTARGARRNAAGKSVTRPGINKITPGRKRDRPGVLHTSVNSDALFAARYPFPDHGAAYSHRRGGDHPGYREHDVQAFQGAVIPEYREYPHNAENAGAQDSFHGREGGIAHSAQCRRRDFVKSAYRLENQDQHNSFAGHLNFPRDGREYRRRLVAEHRALERRGVLPSVLCERISCGRIPGA